MPTSETVLRTERPQRYLVQLCRHAAAMGKTGGGHGPHTPDLHVDAEYSESHGVVTFAPWGQATLDADESTLTVRVEAADEEALQRIQEIVTRDLERFGRRDQLTVTWPPNGTAPKPRPPARHRRRHVPHPHWRLRRSAPKVE